MKYKPYYFVFGSVLLLIVIGGLAYKSMYGSSASSGTYAELAQCIADSGAKFYGAFWCPHCQDQKKAFGDAQKLLPYIECSSPDGKEQLEICVKAGIKSYPTWEFPNGQRATGNIALSSLANLTNCKLPGDYDEEPAPSEPSAPMEIPQASEVPIDS